MYRVLNLVRIMPKMDIADTELHANMITQWAH